ncbi:MAG: hypothetical protein NT036_04155 [Candidatus Omnitrophica bacterium]|nr:hypothetical protein [Candidatus Omnitrophota bacterium]
MMKKIPHIMYAPRGNLSRTLMVFVVVASICASLYAAEEKTKGLEVVPDTVTAIVNKADALITGNLEVNMEIGKDKYRNDYTLDPQGRRIPRATLKRYDSGVR